jgi:hypothetical protein
MPYTIRKSGCSSSKPFGVYKVGDGKRMGCHASRAAAAKQIAAIEASEDKSMGETATSNTIALDPTTLEARVEKPDNTKDYVPGGIISFQELDELQRSERVAWEAQSITDSFSQMVYNIVNDPSLDRESAMNNLVAEFQRRMEGVGKIQHGMVKEMDSVDDEAQKDDPPNPPDVQKSDFTVWKDVDGTWRWMTVYSNKFRDSDRIPEIISEKSHMAFESLVDAGIVPPPDLWLWHVPGTMWGKADMVTYSDGFSLAFGEILPGFEHIAENLSKAIEDGEDIAVSHGMPGQFIIRNEEDPTVIDFHITREISVLPRSAAANKLTGFVVFKELGETEMPIPDEKKEWLLGIGLKADQIEELESGLAKQAAAADNAGIESKDTTDAEPVAEVETEEEVTEQKEEAPVETPEAVVEDKDEEETKDTETPADPKPLSRDEIAEAMNAVVMIVRESNEAVNSRLGDIEAQIKELQVSTDTKVKERVREIPTDSVLDLMKMSVIGQEDAAIDGRTKLAKDGPEETERPKVSQTGSPFIDRLMDAVVTPVTE